MPTSSNARRAALLAAALLLGVSPAPAQERGEAPAGGAADAAGPRDAFLDPSARALLERARARWSDLDEGILSYEAEVRRRIGVALRTPLKDRTLYRAESAARVYWSADGGTVIQALGARSADPTGERPPGELDGLTDEVFDPGGDRIYFGMGGDEDDDDGEIWIEHPLAPGSEAHYRYRSGDTLTVTLPDGRRLRAAELQIVPRERSVHLLSGSLWVEPGDGSLVRALYRLSKTVDVEADTDAFEEDPDLDRIPGIFRPLEFEISLVTVEYSLWDFRHWLPRYMRIEGLARAGIVSAPGSIEVSYRILDVEGAGVEEEGAPAGDVERVADAWLRSDRYGAYEELPGEREGRRIHLLVPVDRERLHDPDVVPPPIWDDAPGFAGTGEVEDLYRLLADVPAPPPSARELRPRLLWGPDRPDLVRYNRVEGLSLGARIEMGVPSPVGPLALGATGRLGIPAWVPSARLDLGWSSPVRSVDLALYRRVADVDERARSLGPGNSATALLFGRDDGEYFRATGASVSLGPPPPARPGYELELSAERHDALEADVEFALSHAVSGGDGSPFRSNLHAREGWEYGAAVSLRPWWGTDPRGAQGGVELLLQGAAGDFEYFRSRLVARSAFPLPGGLRAALEAAGGTSVGEPPVQRHWFLGGARTLRGYRGSAAVGPSFLRGRAELARSFGVMTVAAFSDAGWAGERDAVDLDDGLVSVGGGVSALDGLIRLDLARALREPVGWRLELYVDAVL